MKKGLYMFGGLMLVAAAIFVAAGREAHRHMDSLRCEESIISLGYATRLWASEHEGRLPPDFQSASNELRSTQVLICPGDHVRQPAGNWTLVAADQCSYEIVSPGLAVTKGKSVYLRCKIHGFVLQANGAVFDGVRKITR